MFSTNKKIEKNNVLKKILFTVFAILVYRMGTFVPVPGIDAVALDKFFSSTVGSFFDVINMFSGGALHRMSVFALNIMPYITSSILIQLLSSFYPQMMELKKDGSFGRLKLNQYTKYLTVAIALVQSIAVYFAFKNSSNIIANDSFMFFSAISLSLVSGTLILMWIGEKITVYGFGNGISILIFVGIISSIPNGFSSFLQMLKSGFYSWQYFLFVLSSFSIILFAVSVLERSYRKVPIHNSASRSGTANFLSNRNVSFIPLKINSAGVIPAIFASSVVSVPMIILEFMSKGGDGIMSFFRKGDILYSFCFCILVMFFTYFYSSIVFNVEEVSTNLKKSNCFIEGLRPGKSLPESQ